MSHKLKDVIFDSTFSVLSSCCIFADTLPCRSCGMSNPVTAPVWPTRTDCACAGWALLYLFLKQKIIHHIKFWRNIPEHFRYSKGFKAIFPMCVEVLTELAACYSSRFTPWMYLTYYPTQLFLHNDLKVSDHPDGVTVNYKLQLFRYQILNFSNTVYDAYLSACLLVFVSLVMSGGCCACVWCWAAK